MPHKSRLSNPIFVLIDEVIRVNGRVKGLFAKDIAATGLTSMAYAVFTAVAESQNPPTVPQIGRSLGHPRQVIQRAVAELLAEGLVEKLVNPDHKRAPLLQPSSKGREAKRKWDLVAIETAGRLRKYLDEEQCRRVAADLHELRVSIERFVREERA